MFWNVFFLNKSFDLTRKLIRRTQIIIFCVWLRFGACALSSFTLGRRREGDSFPPRSPASRTTRCRWAETSPSTRTWSSSCRIPARFPRTDPRSNRFFRLWHSSNIFRLQGWGSRSGISWPAVWGSGNLLLIPSKCVSYKIKLQKKNIFISKVKVGSGSVKRS